MFDRNLNRLKLEPANEVVFIDFEHGVTGLDCGQKVLHKDQQRGDYLSFYAIVKTEDGSITKVLVVNTGYFLE